MEKVLKIMSTNEAVARLKEAGLDGINPQRLMAGIEQKVYPFGGVIQMSGRRVCEVYSVLLEKWIEERS